MSLLDRHSIRSKIIATILVTNLLGLGIAFSLIIINDLRIFKQELEVSSEAVAQLVGAYNVVSLLFENHEDSQDTLEVLDSHYAFLEGYILNSQGDVVAHHMRGDLSFGQPDPGDEIDGFRDGYLKVIVPVIDQEDRLGTVHLRFSTETLDRTIKNYLRNMLLVFAGVILVSGIISFLLGRVVSGPILELADVARKISCEGDYSLRVRTIGRDEIATLRDVFNNMLDQIELRQRELERSNRELDHFARATSHDLKAPLRGISTLAGWIEEDLEAIGNLPEETAERLQLLQGRAKRMEGLIQGILEYARAGRMDSELQLVDVGQLVAEVSELLAPPEEFEIRTEGELPVFHTKKVRLQQVFSNLISNAIKHHDRQSGKIVVSARTRSSTYEFAVSDDGPGIPAQFHEKVFQMFQTLQSRDVLESTGVGLPLVQRIVKEEGCEVALESGEGRGTTIRFTWPAELSEEQDLDPGEGDR
ncbi:MAG: HAMP domain-containing protein [Deltaproteobacteria bacterium]|nr:HAMP domain-containing protein [Deltaproteobacteria bacterium]